MIFHPVMNMMGKGQGSYSHIIYSNAYNSKQQALGHSDQMFTATYVEMNIGRFEWVLSFKFTILHPFP